MDLQTIRQVAREDIVKTSESFMSNAYIDRQANIAYKKVMAFIDRVQGYRSSSIKEVYIDLISTDGLTAGQVGYKGEYPYFSDMKSLERMEVSYDGVSFRPAEIYHMSENNRSEHLDDDIQAIATENAPIIRDTRRSMFLRPLKETAGNVTGGLHIWYTAREADLVNLGDVPNFEETYHEIIPVMVAHHFFKREGDRTGITTTAADIQALKRDIKAEYQRKVKVNKRMNPVQDNMK